MFQLCEDLKATEEALTDAAKSDIVDAIQDIEIMMVDGDKITFNRALASVAQDMADRFQVKDIFIIRFMAEAYKQNASDGSSDFWAFGQQLNETHYRPQIEAEKQERASSKTSTTARSYSKP